MSRLKSISNRAAGRFALAAGATMAAMGALLLVHGPAGSSTDIGGWAGYLSLGMFAVTLVSIAPVYSALARYAGSRRAEQGGVLAAAGTIVLAIAVVSSIAHGRDYGFFALVAPVANAAWLVGAIVIAVALKRAGRVPTPVALCLPLVQIATLPLSSLGGPILAGGYFMAVGYLLANDAIERRSQPIAEPAHA